jgi:hypothetical protein
MKTYILKLKTTSTTNYNLYDGTTLVSDSDLATLFGSAGSAYFTFDFNEGTPTNTTSLTILNSQDTAVMTNTGLEGITEDRNFKGVWADSATAFTSFTLLKGVAMDEAELTTLVGMVKNAGGPTVLSHDDTDANNRIYAWTLPAGKYIVRQTDITKDIYVYLWSNPSNEYVYPVQRSVYLSATSSAVPVTAGREFELEVSECTSGNNRNNYVQITCRHNGFVDTACVGKPGSYAGRLKSPPVRMNNDQIHCSSNEINIGQDVCGINDDPYNKTSYGMAGTFIGSNIGYSSSTPSGNNLSTIIFRDLKAPSGSYYADVLIGTPDEGTAPTLVGEKLTAVGNHIKNLGGSNKNCAVSLGYGSKLAAQGSVALGAYSEPTAVGEVNIGSTVTSCGYNTSNYRLLSGLYDPQGDHDAATKGYVDGLVGNVASALNTINNGSSN